MYFSILSFGVLTVTAGVVAAELAADPLNPRTFVKRVDSSVKRHPHSGSPDSNSYRDGSSWVQSTFHSQTSPSLPVKQECNIFAINTDGVAYGYISPVQNVHGEYYSFQPNQDGSLLVSFVYSPDSPSRLKLKAENGPNSAYPLFGGITGYHLLNSSLGPGNYNFAYLGGTTPTPPGSPAVAGANSFTATTGIDEPIESAIWTYDPVTYAITAQWINEDGSTPATYIIYTLDALVLTGDVSVTTKTFGDGDTLVFECVPPEVTPA